MHQLDQFPKVTRVQVIERGMATRLEKHTEIAKPAHRASIVFAFHQLEIRSQDVAQLNIRSPARVNIAVPIHGEHPPAAQALIINRLGILQKLDHILDGQRRINDEGGIVVSLDVLNQGVQAMDDLFRT